MLFLSLKNIISNILGSGNYIISGNSKVTDQLTLRKLRVVSLELTCFFSIRNEDPRLVEQEEPKCMSLTKRWDYMHVLFRYVHLSMSLTKRWDYEKKFQKSRCLCVNISA